MWTWAENIWNLWICMECMNMSRNVWTCKGMYGDAWQSIDNWWKCIEHETQTWSQQHQIYRIPREPLLPLVNYYVSKKSVHFGPFDSNSDLCCNIQEAWYSGRGLKYKWKSFYIYALLSWGTIEEQSPFKGIFICWQKKCQCLSWTWKQVKR